jgi:hypothetical protein
MRSNKGIWSCTKERHVGWKVFVELLSDIVCVYCTFSRECNVYVGQYGKVSEVVVSSHGIQEQKSPSSNPTQTTLRARAKNTRMERHYLRRSSHIVVSLTTSLCTNITNTSLSRVPLHASECIRMPMDILNATYAQKPP